jgi:hypothetical protein
LKHVSPVDGSGDLSGSIVTMTADAPIVAEKREGHVGTVARIISTRGGRSNPGNAAERRSSNANV